MRISPFLVLAALLAIAPASRVVADSSTPPTQQGSTPGTTPKKKHHHHQSSNTATATTTHVPKLDNKVPPGTDASVSH